MPYEHLDKPQDGWKRVWNFKGRDWLVYFLLDHSKDQLPPWIDTSSLLRLIWDQDPAMVKAVSQTLTRKAELNPSVFWIPSTQWGSVYTKLGDCMNLLRVIAGHKRRENRDLLLQHLDAFEATDLWKALLKWPDEARARHFHYAMSSKMYALRDLLDEVAARKIDMSAFDWDADVRDLKDFVRKRVCRR